MTTPAASSRPDTAGRERRDTLAARLALFGAGLGVLAGLVELIAGAAIRDWVGNKQDTTRLGLTTTLLALIAAAAATRLQRPAGATGARRVAAIFGLALPAVLCFTTVGRLWYLPGVLLLVAGALLLSGTRRDEFAAAITEEHWRVAMLAVCGAYYIGLGATALGGAGALGIIGGALLWGVPAAAKRSRPAAYAVLFAAAVPFAALTWWSVVTPLIAALAIWFGHTVIRRRRDHSAPASSHARRAAADRDRTASVA